ncbi:MAG: phosphonate C-P lyase system protein PhnH [Micrococcales bacterium]|nr:phosphonate C-P lyase system protein PhnH [Micrococcales bacterium]MCL2667913.1 phosphonate C-P lyase system protein PhnH [Micrococcales bacterium]
MNLNPTVLAPGFADRVHDAQQTFRVLLDAFAHPTTSQVLRCQVSAPGALTQGAAALVLALADDSTPLWLDPALACDAAVTAWLEFHTGARVVNDPSGAAFALVAAPASLPPLAVFALGTDEAPHTSTTVVVMTGQPTDEVVLGAEGPGFAEPTLWRSPFPPCFAQQWAANAAVFPRGVDLVLASDDALVALPRTTRLTMTDHTEVR